MKTRIFVDLNRAKNATCVILNNEDNIEECVFSRDDKKSIKSNIYLATVWRVEHSLQAAFVQYGGDKAGFLPFKRIHPDYYQLPISEKEAITKEIKAKIAAKREDIKEENDEDESDKDDYEDFAKEYYELVYNRYNIQEVIKKGQKMLVQVFKDERGNKGVSLTTYISIAGRCAVFMPNNPGGIGISRKISKYDVRKRIYNIVKNFQIQDGSSLIVRTLGAQSGIEDFKKDYNYLQKIWEKIKQDAVNSKTVPALIYQELDIIKQTIRDNYSQTDVSGILVNDKNYFNEIKTFIKELIPGEEKKVRLYSDPVPMFDKYAVNKKIQELLSPRVELNSGGYLIINPTEALTSIDINSGKATAEKNIEETALQINTEAAFEIAKQLRLRGIGGLIVVDFIDMMDQKNRRKLEDVLKTAFADDKAKVQFTKPSIFGLVEISRQRMRNNITEILEKPCVYCSGTGCVKKESIIAETILKRITDFVADKKIGTKIKADAIYIKASEESIAYIKEVLLEDVKIIEKNIKCKIHFTTFKQYPNDFISLSLESKNPDGDKFRTFEINLFDVEKKKKSLKISVAKQFRILLEKVIDFLES